MIVSFKDRSLKRFYERGDVRGIRPDLAARIRTILGRLDIAECIDGLRIHSFRLHPLKGDRKGFWSITARANWRIIFRFNDGNVADVELIDYH